MFFIDYLFKKKKINQLIKKNNQLNYFHIIIHPEEQSYAIPQE